MEFFIAVRVSDHEEGVDIAVLRDALERRGPEISSPIAQWIPIGDIGWFASGAPEELRPIETNGVSLFAERDLVAAMRDDVYY
ncbi:MAG: hypothetical protein O7F17_10405, partial [Planctomycetota bacterium]|nr:hypothetical protein [Planctomycetota bacterium]